MKTLFLDCGMGAAGDMLTAALLELLPDREAFLNELNGLGIPGVRVFAEESTKCGIRGTHIHVTVTFENEGPRHIRHLAYYLRIHQVSKSDKACRDRCGYCNVVLHKA